MAPVFIFTNQYYIENTIDSFYSEITIKKYQLKHNKQISFYCFINFGHKALHFFHIGLIS